MKYKITCGKCGFITHDADDMIRHLSLTQEDSKDNCRERFIKVEDVEEEMDIEINFDELMEKYKVKKIPDNLFRLIREVMDIMERKYNKDKPNGFKAHGRTYNYETPAEKGKEAIKRLRERNG